MQKAITGITVFVWFFVTGHLMAQAVPPFGTYYQQRATHFATLPQTADDIIFLGNSLTDGAEWSELFGDLRIKNRGISGDLSAGVLNRIDEIITRKPAKIFLLIGTNDLAGKVSPDTVLQRILRMADLLKTATPGTHLFVQGILPVNAAFKKFPSHTGNGALIRALNAALQTAAAAHRYTFIDIYRRFADAAGDLDAAYTNDGLHLTGKGYMFWKHCIYPYVYDLEPRAALLPLPVQLRWEEGFFPVYACSTIYVTDSSLLKEAWHLQKRLREKGMAMAVKNSRPSGEPYIELAIPAGAGYKSTDENYRLSVKTEAVVLTANSAHGIFNGLQTLLQLARSGAMIDACDITDRPAFAWRGYMVDVGRNYMSLDLLKQQIDIMSRYKLNVFHFHFTEDIAWRLASESYPRLTEPENMLRDKGLYYTKADMKELIAYCAERHITLLPEIDMPGHSAAFRRATGWDMQSDSGMVIVKRILEEFMTDFDLPYLHIGADEVKITNKDFIPAITEFIRSHGKQVVGWQPGGNFLPGTILQLWKEDGKTAKESFSFPVLDSRHLYLNHFDPLESVVTIFNRRIANKAYGDSMTLGGIICLWNDRAVGKEEDLLTMNPVYPSMLAFAERTWLGGGQEKWIANLSDGDTTAFAHFEKRMLDHRQTVFAGYPFPYTRQSQLSWQLYGPYPNDGGKNKQFRPEYTHPPYRKEWYANVTGGTVVLRHWWYPLISGAISQPRENETFYAVTGIQSDEDGERDFWIGFNNLSRSMATDSPPKDAWDDRGSRIWVNGEEIKPPVWKHAGKKGNLEMPLTDEGYEYRSPVKIRLVKGMNEVKIKLPVTSFRSRGWENPVKWMFTFAPVGD
ncbi:family 20 glycosylhydrolase [Sediminibacterium soli]|uniref:family 20 glycosylhydrolase n=1 Tax=Sediminibacterium soli TaxID=2698829 RepID=UPI00137A1304|nr:family 20 glycosylhydrolase [Sediminibacterium soli]NCI45412.1 family 20 glycosylhydrolase [Sediminibacterium soli]